MDEGQFKFEPDRPRVPNKYRSDPFACRPSLNYNGTVRICTVPSISQAYLTYTTSLVSCEQALATNVDGTVFKSEKCNFLLCSAPLFIQLLSVPEPRLEVLQYRSCTRTQMWIGSHRHLNKIVQFSKILSFLYKNPVFSFQKTVKLCKTNISRYYKYI